MERAVVWGCKDAGAGDRTAPHPARSPPHSRDFLPGPIPGAAWPWLSGNPASNSLGKGKKLHLNWLVPGLAVGVFLLIRKYSGDL